MSTLKQRFAELQATRPDISQADLARATHAKPPSVNAWFTGETKSMKPGTAAKAAALYGVDALWLATGEGYKTATATATLTAPTGTLSATGSASKPPLAQIEPAQGATDTIAIVDTLLDKMAATDQTDRAMIGATLAALAANPHDAKKRDLLLQMLDSSGFAEVRQKVA